MSLIPCNSLNVAVRSRQLPPLQKPKARPWKIPQKTPTLALLLCQRASYVVLLLLRA
jgi:hypothetical protein